MRHICTLSFVAMLTVALLLQHISPAAHAQTQTEYVSEVPYFLSSSHPSGEGFLRIVNWSRESASLTIRAIDETGTVGDVVTLDVPNGQARHVNSTDLEFGNSDKGLVGSAGTGTGDWRVEVVSNRLSVEVHSFVRTLDGFLTSMGEIPSAYTLSSQPNLLFFDLPIVNPARNTKQISKLRITNHEDQQIPVALLGFDGVGRSSGCTVRVPAGATEIFDATQLEGGSVCRGQGETGFGAGEGKWYLIAAVNDEHRITVVNVMESPTGHLSNLSSPLVLKRSVEVERTEPSGDDHPNAAPGTSVNVPSATAGQLETGGDQDFFRFNLNQSGLLTVYSTGGTDTRGRVAQVDGSFERENDDGGSGTNFRISAEVPAGAYDVEVRGFSPSTTGSYTLRVEFGDSEPEPPTEPPTDDNYCRVNDVVDTGEACQIYNTTIEFGVRSNGTGCLAGSICAGRQHTWRNSTINGETITFVASRNDDDSWTIAEVDPQPPAAAGLRSKAVVIDALKVTTRPGSKVAYERLAQMLDAAVQ